jgi:hypothetical protein
VGARFQYARDESDEPDLIEDRWRVTRPGFSRIDEPGCVEVETLDGFRAKVLSLPQPIADEVVELGTLAKGDHFELVDLPAGFNPQWLGALLRVTGAYPSGAVDATIVRPAVPGGYRSSGVLTSGMKVRRVPAPTAQSIGCEDATACVGGLATGSKMPDVARSYGNPAKRPPCDACGEESGPSRSGAELYMVDNRAARLCPHCWHKRNPNEVEGDVRARRAKQTSGSVDASSLPTYDKISGWLGAEWVMCSPSFAIQVPTPWWSHDGKSHCYLKHTPTGQRVEVTAPKEGITEARWGVWFDHIKQSLPCGPEKRRDWGSRLYAEHVRWLDPDTKTSMDFTHPCEACGEPATDGLMDNGDWVGLRDGDPEEVLEAIRSKQFTGTDAPLRKQQPPEPRWQTTDPARIAALEAKLAMQVRGGGQDCQSARRLVERADDLFLAEHERAHIASEKRAKAGMHRRWLGEHGVEGCEPGIQSGPRLMRHELSQEQRLNRNRTGR